MRMLLLPVTILRLRNICVHFRKLQYQSQNILMYLFTTDKEAVLLGMQEPSDFLFTSFAILISLTAHFIEQFTTSHTKKESLWKEFYYPGRGVLCFKK